MKKLFLIATFLIPFYTFSQFENIERDAPWHLDEIHGKTKKDNTPYTLTITEQHDIQFNLLSDSIVNARFKQDKIEGKYWVKDSTLYFSSIDKKTGKEKVRKSKILDFSDNRITLKPYTGNEILILKNKIEEEETLPEDMYFLKSEGLSISGVALKINNVFGNRNTFKLEEKVQIKLKDIRGMKANEGVDSLEMNMIISTRNKKDTLFYLNKILAFPKIGIPDVIVKFATNLLTDEYDAKVTLSDINGPGKLNFTFPFEVNSFEQNKIKNKNLSIEGYYFSSLEDKTTILAPHSKLENGTYALFYGMDGFKVKKNKIYPGIAFRIEDENGKEMLSFENALKTNKENGLELPLESNNISAYFELTDGQVNEKCTVFFTLYDFYSKGRITIKQEFN